MLETFWSRAAAALALMTPWLTGPTVAQAPESVDRDKAAWQQAQSLATAEAFEAYLRQFPDGRYTREAFRGAVEAATSVPGNDAETPAAGAVAPGVEAPRQSRGRRYPYE